MRQIFSWRGILLVFLGILVDNGGAYAAHSEGPPNIVLIFIDDLGVGDIGPFGNKTVRTPHLDRLAREGRKFTSFYATPVCSMSRAALMTGCYNPRVSIPGVLFPYSRIGLHPDEITIADILKERGYSTACVGKWHLGHHPRFLPTRQGFDRYFGLPYSNDMHAGRQNYPPLPLMRDEKTIETEPDQGLLTKRYTQEAITFIREQQAKPFFLYLPHTMVHVPLAASPAFRGKSKAGLLGDAIEEIDWSVGEVLRVLDELQLTDNTLVIFSSDNGAAVGSSAPYRGKKGSNYEGGVREPCIMRWPKKIPANTICHQLAGNIDVLPTLAAIAGGQAPKDRVMDGRDISSLMFDANPKPVRDTHLYYHGERLDAIRIGDWKLFPTSPAALARGKAKKKAPPKVDAGPELYNLAQDPYETRNVADEFPDIVTKLRQEAERRAAEIHQNRRPAGKIDP